MTPETFTFRRTWFSAGAGFGVSYYCKTSGPPDFVIWIAFLFLFLDGVVVGVFFNHKPACRQAGVKMFYLKSLFKNLQKVHTEKVNKELR